jgi:hypothetical protein
MINYSPGLTAELNDLIDGEFKTPNFRKRARQVLISVAEEMAQQMILEGAYKKPHRNTSSLMTERLRKCRGYYHDEPYQ